MRSAARVLGTAKVRTSSSRAMARTPSNHRPHVFGASWERRAVAPCSQISAALTPRSNSTGASTGVEKVPLAGPLEAAAVRQEYSASGPGEVRLRSRVVGEQAERTTGLSQRTRVAKVDVAARYPALRPFHASPYTRCFA